MARYAWLGAALLATALASQAKAQAIIQEPGYCAQFYPNANCQNKGPGNPYTDPNFHRNDADANWQANRAIWQNNNAAVIAPRHHHHRAHKHTY
jgi:hypothetical protein